MDKLDMNRPYGTVCGTGVHHRFEQDGKRFDAKGQRLDDALAQAQPVATEPADPQLDAQLESETPHKKPHAKAKK